MHVTWGQVLGTVVATGVVGLLVWLVTVPLRWRSVTGLIASVVLTGPLAVLGGIGWALLLGPRVGGPMAALELSLVAVLVASVESGIGAARAHRRFLRASGALRAAVEQLADHTDIPDVHPSGVRDSAASRPLLAELEGVRTQLSELARGLAAQRARDHALDASRRALIAWVSGDLHAPLTVLRAMSELDAGAVSPDVRGELDRLVGAVDDLFDLATAGPGRPDATVVFARSEPTLLADVLGAAVTSLEPLARLHGVGVHVHGSTAVQVGLLGPGGDDLGRRLVALMVDAIRHSSRGSTVRVDVAPEPADAGLLRIELRPGGHTVIGPMRMDTGTLRGVGELALRLPVHVGA